MAPELILASLSCFFLSLLRWLLPGLLEDTEKVLEEALEEKEKAEKGSLNSGWSWRWWSSRDWRYIEG